MTLSCCPSSLLSAFAGHPPFSGSRAAFLISPHMIPNSTHNLIPFVAVQSLSPVRLSVTPWTTARQTSLSTISQSLLKLMSIKPSHLLSPPSPPPFNLSQHQGLFQ